MSATARTRQRVDRRQPEIATDYIELLDRIHRHLLPRTYAEIGVCTGRSLALSLPGTRAVGVDPEPRITWRVQRSAKIVPLTSDEFFQQYRREDAFGDTALDLAFIDGMHLFEFALRDFINVEKWCTGESAVLIHDCNPIDEPSAARVRTTTDWTGDVWKLVLCLKEFRPDLHVSTIDVPPSGLCLVTGLDPSSRVLESRYDEICQRFIDLDYGLIRGRSNEMLNVVANDWTVVSRMLEAEPFRAGNADRLRLLRSIRIPQRAVLRHMIKRSHISAPLLRSVYGPVRRLVVAHTSKP